MASHLLLKPVSGCDVRGFKHLATLTCTTEVASTADAAGHRPVTADCSWSLRATQLGAEGIRVAYRCCSPRSGRASRCGGQPVGPADDPDAPSVRPVRRGGVPTSREERSINAYSLIEEILVFRVVLTGLSGCCVWTTDRSLFTKHCDQFALDRFQAPPRRVSRRDAGSRLCRR